MTRALMPLPPFKQGLHAIYTYVRPAAPTCIYPGCSERALQHSSRAGTVTYYTGCGRHYAFMHAQAGKTISLIRVETFQLVLGPGLTQEQAFDTYCWLGTNKAP